MRFQSNFNVMISIESNIRAPALLNVSNSLRKSDKMFSKPRILLLFIPTCLINSNSILHEHTCKNLIKIGMSYAFRKLAT